MRTKTCSNLMVRIGGCLQSLIKVIMIKFLNNLKELNWVVDDNSGDL